MERCDMNELVRKIMIYIKIKELEADKFKMER